MRATSFFLATGIVFSTCAAVSAADMNEARFADGPYDWSGFYAGVLLGYGVGTNDTEGNPGFDNSAPDDEANLDPDGFVGGAVLGYNFQRGSFVFGPELEIGYNYVEDSVFFPDGDDYFANSEYGFYGSLSARIGYAFDRTLVSGRIGAIVTEIDAGYGDIDGNDPDPNSSVFDRSERWGLTVGASVERAFQVAGWDWIGRLDYSYSIFDRKTLTDASDEDYEIDNDLHRIRIGLVKKF